MSNPFKSLKNEDPTEKARRSQIFDKFSRPVALNDIIQIGLHGATCWRVLDIRPDLNPESAVPNGQILTLQSMESVGVIGGQPCTDLLKVRDASEYMKPAPAVEIGVDPGAAEGDQTVRVTDLEGSDGGPLPTPSGPRLVTEH